MLRLKARVKVLSIVQYRPRWFTDGEIEVKYIAPLLDKGTFIPKARIIGEEPPRSGRLTLEVWGENQHGQKLAVGRASCLAPEG